MLVPWALLELLPMPFVLRVDDERRPFQLQDHVGDEGALRPKVRWVPCKGRHRLSPASGLEGATHLARNTAHHSLDPSFKELLHWHRPRYAFKIAQPGESSLVNSPVNRLQALDEAVATHRASKPRLGIRFLRSATGDGVDFPKE